MQVRKLFQRAQEFMYDMMTMNIINAYMGMTVYYTSKMYFKRYSRGTPRESDAYSQGCRSNFSKHTTNGCIDGTEVEYLSTAANTLFHFIITAVHTSEWGNLVSTY